MEVVKENQETGTPVSNEEKLQEENQKLRAMLTNLGKQLEQMNMVNTIKRLELLFKVIENKTAFSKEFVASCVKEIEAVMTLEEEESKE